VVGVLFFGLVCWGSIEPLGHAWTSNEYEGEGALRVPSWPAKLVIVVGTALASISYILLALRNFQAARAGRGPVGATSSSH
jgi:TRAP-type mannitol/chloroaromatic compound transport system permease small subunit